MIRAGIIGTNTSHAGVYAGLLNGIDGGTPAVEGARAIGVWSSGKEGLSGFHSDAAELARTFRIDEVINDPADLVGSVDLVLVLDDFDGGALHPQLARPFLEAGVPTYIDKPMALDVTDAAGLLDLAERTGTPLMSCSALRFADELHAMKSDLGELSTVFSVGPGGWYNYGIHAVEAAVAVCGAGARSVLQFHSGDRDITVISHQDGPRMVIGTLRDAGTGFRVTAYGSGGVADAEISDYQGFYANTMRAAIRMAETGTPPIARETTLEVLGILAAGLRSAETGHPVQLSDVLSEASR